MARLSNSDLRELQTLLKGLSDNNDNLQDKLQRLKLKDKSGSLNEIDDLLSCHLKDVANLDRKVS